MKWHQIEQTNYEISENGEVRNIKNKQLKKLRSGATSPYLIVQIYINNGKRKNFLVHRLVANYFIPNPESKSQVNHIDKNKLNNHVSNLEWVTPRENMKHHYDNGGIKRDNKTYKGKFGKDHNRSIKIFGNGVLYNGLSEASRATGISVGSIFYHLRSGNIHKKTGIYFQLAKLP